MNAMCEQAIFERPRQVFEYFQLPFAVGGSEIEGKSG